MPRDNYPDKLPADLRIPNGHANQTMTSKPTKVVSSTNSNSLQQRPHQKPPMKPNTNRPIKPQEPSRESDDGNQIGQRRCEGECVSGLFALFCDGLDEEAYCPNDATCCLASENNNGPPTTPRPVGIFSRLLIVQKKNYNCLTISIDSSTKMPGVLCIGTFTSILSSTSCNNSKNIEL